MRGVQGSAERRRRLLQLNPMVDEALTMEVKDEDRDEDWDEALNRNAETVRQSFSLEGCGRRLQEIYARVTASSRSSETEPLARGEAILDSFLDLRRFHPLRVETE